MHEIYFDLFCYYKIRKFFQFGFVDNLVPWHTVGRKTRCELPLCLFIFSNVLRAVLLISLILFLPFIPHAPPPSKSNSAMFLQGVPGYSTLIGNVTAKHGGNDLIFYVQNQQGSNGCMNNSPAAHYTGKPSLANHASYPTHTASSGNFISLPSQQNTGRTLK